MHKVELFLPKTGALGHWGIDLSKYASLLFEGINIAELVVVTKY